MVAFNRIEKIEQILEKCGDTLTAKEKDVLIFRYIYHKRLDECAALYNVHHNTISRWIKKARLKLLKSK